MRVREFFVLGTFLITMAANASAQRDTTAHSSRAWIAPTAAVATAVVFDSEIREWSVRARSTQLDRIAKDINPLGTGKVLTPTIAAAYLGARIAHDTAFSRGVLKVAAAYAAVNVAEGLLKPLIGRERPHVEGNPREFHPFSRSGDWHSLPSAHVAHITAIVSAIDAGNRSRTISVIGDALIAMMSFDRIYEDQHWASDAAFTVALTPPVARAAIRFLDSHLPHLR